jgi:hypothetical protein
VKAVETGADGSVRDPAADPAMVPADQQMLTGSEAEIAVAVADFECREETDFMDSYIGRVKALQQEFIEDNKDALGQFMAAVEELGL